MLERILGWSLANRFLVAVMALLLVGGGLVAAAQLPIDAFPDVTNVQVQVLTSAPALGPEEVERFVTTPVELAMSGLPGLEEVRSVSKFGLSSVTVVFDDDTDIYFARQLVSERVAEAKGEIPEGYGEPELGPVSSGLGEIFQFEVRGAGKTAMELRSILDWQIAPRLRKVKGVVEVNTFGGELKTYEVAIHPERLARYAVTTAQIFEALQRNNANAGGAYIEKNREQYLVRGEGLVQSREDLADIVVATSADGTPIFVRQVASVDFAPMVRQGAVTRDGRGEAVTGIVMMIIGGNARQVVDDAKAVLADLAPHLKKLGVATEVFYDRTDLVDSTVQTVATNLLEGGALVVVVLLLMLLNLRAGLIAATAIPLSMLVGFIVMRWAGVSGNLMSLGAIDFGLIVDGAVIVIENAMRLVAERSHALGRPLTRRERSQSVLRASHEVMRAATFGVVIIAVVYLPILSLAGIEGKLFKPMALTVLFVLGGSLLVMLTFIPVLASVFLPRRVTERESPVLWLARKGYEPLLRKALAPIGRWVALAVAVGVVTASVLVGAGLGAEFMPRLGEGAIAIQAWRIPSVALEQSIAQTTDLEAVVRAHFPEVTTVVSKTGRAEIATDPMGVEVSDVLVMLKPQAEWVTAPTQEGLVAALDAVLERELPGTIFSFSQPIELRVSELVSGVRSDVALEIYGHDLGVLAHVADRAVSVLAKVPGAADVKAQQIAGLPVLRLKVDRQAIARLGINAGDVLDLVSTLGGRNAGVVLEGNERYAIQLRYAAEDRRDIPSILALKVAAPGGAMVPLRQLVTVSLEDGPAEIGHDDGQRRISVELNVRGRDLAGFVAEAEAAIVAADVIPAGYFTDWGGQFENLTAATGRLALAVPIALLMIFVLLYVSQGSASAAGLIYLNVPFAVSGGLFALALRDLPLSISAGVGFISLFGVAVLTGLVLVSELERLWAGGASALDAAATGGRVKLRAILTVALVASLGFIPMALATGAGAEVQRPLATVVIGGIVTSTLATLFVLPAAYSIVRGRVRARPEVEADAAPDRAPAA